MTSYMNMKHRKEIKDTNLKLDFEPDSVRHVQKYLNHIRWKAF